MAIFDNNNFSIEVGFSNFLKLQPSKLGSSGRSRRGKIMLGWLYRVGENSNLNSVITNSTEPWKYVRFSCDIVVTVSINLVSYLGAKVGLILFIITVISITTVFWKCFLIIYFWTHYASNLLSISSLQKKHRKTLNASQSLYSQQKMSPIEFTATQKKGQSCKKNVVNMFFFKTCKTVNWIMMTHNKIVKISFHQITSVCCTFEKREVWKDRKNAFSFMHFYSIQ